MDPGILLDFILACDYFLMYTVASLNSNTPSGSCRLTEYLLINMIA